jgi:MoaD family protein
MNVKVQYLGQVRVIANRKEEELEISPNAIVQELLQKLSGMYGKAFDMEVFEEDGENLRDDLTVAVNGTAIRQLDYLNTRLKQNDTITLFPIFPGGG